MKNDSFMRVENIQISPTGTSLLVLFTGISQNYLCYEKQFWVFDWPKNEVSPHVKDLQ